MKIMTPILIVLTLSLVGCAQEQAEQTEAPVSDVESSAHEAVEAEGVDHRSGTRLELEETEFELTRSR